MIGSGIEIGAGAIESMLGTLGISAVIGDGAATGTAAGTAAGMAAGMAATAGTAAVGRGFIDGSEGITNGRGAGGKGAAGFAEGAPGTMGGTVRGGRPGMAKPAGLKPGSPPAAPGKFMKLKSGMVGAGICMPG